MREFDSGISFSFESDDAMMGICFGLVVIGIGGTSGDKAPVTRIVKARTRLMPDSHNDDREICSTVFHSLRLSKLSDNVTGESYSESLTQLLYRRSDCDRLISRPLTRLLGGSLALALAAFVGPRATSRAVQMGFVLFSRPNLG